MIQSKLETLHNLSFKNKEACEASKTCACFHCLAFFSPQEISEWVEEKRSGGGLTAICPKCGIDAVLPESEETKITPDLLKEMQDEFFEISFAQNIGRKFISCDVVI